jgi:hypothetical protein
VLSGRSNSIIAGTRTNLAWHLQRVLRKTLPKDDFLETQAVWRECIAIGDLARMIVTDGHGGIILLVPENSGPWCNSLRPFAYRFADPDTTIRDAIRLELKNGVAQAEVIERLWATTVPDEVKTLVIGANKPRSGDIRRSVRATASLAGVDGAIVMTRDTRVLGFGAKISVVGDVAPQVCIFERDRRAGDAAPSPLDDRVGGTRHQSAIRFVDANRDATAVVISQDRRMTVIHWEEQINSVAFVRGVDW